MNEEEDGGEHTNAIYYERFWSKPPKVRTEAKTAKRRLEETMLLRNLPVGLVEDLLRFHHKRKHTTHRPLLR